MHEHFSESERAWRAIVQRSFFSHGHDSLHARTLSWLAVLCSRQNRNAEAESLFKSAIEIQKQVSGENDIATQSTIRRLVWFYEGCSRYADAEPYRREIIRIDKRIRPNSIETAISINELGLLFSTLGRNEEAASQFEEAIRMRALSENRIAYAAVMNNLARVYHRLGRTADAELFYKKALKIRQEEFGDDFSLTARPRINLAQLYISQARFTDAEPLLKEAIRIDEAEPERWEKRIHGPIPTSVRKEYQHDIMISMRLLAYLYRAQGRNPEAETMNKRFGKLMSRWPGVGTEPVISTPL